MIKFHKNLVEAVIHIIEGCMNQGNYADKLIEKVLKSDKKWGSRDRSFIAETSYDIIRNYRLLNHCVSNSGKSHDIVAAYFITKQIRLPDWELFSGVNEEKVIQLYESSKTHFGIYHSYPDELIDLLRNEIGERYQSELIALNNPAPLVLRTNPLVISRNELSKLLEEQGILTKTIAEISDGLVVEKKFNVFRNDLFLSGHFEIQDASSQFVAPFLQAEAGMRVIDACAGAGGKSLHLAALMKNRGKILSLDIEEWKLLELKKRAKRNRVQIIETRHIQNNKVVKRLHESCDRLLLDVPCSGLGVLRRNPDAKWKINSELIQRMKHIQQDLLLRYSTMLKPGGKMVYATCSILPSENSQQILYFCKQQHHFQLEEEKFISPMESGFDGFYMARLKKL